jgi:hypothetical protein
MKYRNKDKNLPIRIFYIIDFTILIISGIVSMVANNTSFFKKTLHFNTDVILISTTICVASSIGFLAMFIIQKLRKKGVFKKYN